MLRERIQDALNLAVEAGDDRAVATIRLILTAVADRDVCARIKGRQEGVRDEDVVAMLNTMIAQRQESIDLYEKGGRLELAEQEREEIAVIARFLPEQLDEGELGGVIESLVGELGAKGPKDMGRVMTVMQERYHGRMDARKACGLLRERLA
ncbi:MAG: GatB/YqeY domain-containing protein [Alphaproteobacteria bacterium]